MTRVHGRDEKWLAVGRLANDAGPHDLRLQRMCLALRCCRAPGILPLGGVDFAIVILVESGEQRRLVCFPLAQESGGGRVGGFNRGIRTQLAGHRQLVAGAEQPLGVAILTAGEESGRAGWPTRGHRFISVPDVMTGRGDLRVDGANQALTTAVGKYKGSDAAGAVDRAPASLSLGVAVFFFDVEAPPDAGPRAQGRRG